MRCFIFILLLLTCSVFRISAQQSGVIIIDPNPPDAKVFIEGKDVMGRDTLYVNTGSYFMKAIAPGFIDFTDTISIAAGDTFYLSPIMDFNYRQAAEKSAFTNVKAVRILSIGALGAGVLATAFAITASNRKDELPEKIDAYNNATTPEELEKTLNDYNDTFDAYNSSKDAAIVSGITCVTAGIVAAILAQNYKAKQEDNKKLSATYLRRFDPIVYNQGKSMLLGFCYKF